MMFQRIKEPMGLVLAFCSSETLTRKNAPSFVPSALEGVNKLEVSKKICTKYTSHVEIQAHFSCFITKKC